VHVAIVVVLVLLLAAAGEAGAGRVHPRLETQLGALPPGATLPVIVEMVVQADPGAAAASAPPRQRRLRARAVVDALRDVANRHQASIRAALAREQALSNVRRVVPLWVFNGLAITATEPVIRALAARPDVWEVRPDAVIAAPPPVRLASAATPTPAETVSAWNIDQIRAPEVWALDPAYTGAGRVVGSFDTGVDLSHPDLQSRYRGNHAISWFDPYGQHPSPVDPNGHGTHTTGTAVGGDASGANIGVAPGARWIAAKAWTDSGLGLASAFHQIFEWFLAPGGDPANAPDVVNSSWGFEDAGCIPEFQADIEALRQAGIVPVFSAGNDGPEPGSVRSPAAGPEAFAVGATDFFDDVAFFSARGPSPCGGDVKPEVGAPGVSIFSAFPGGSYVPADGTSMAAPHVSGAVAVLRSINPALTVEEIETALLLGAVDLGAPGPDDAFGAGRLDLYQSAQIVLGGAGRPVVTIVATAATATEVGETPATLTVRRTGPTDAALTLLYAVSGTATPGADYVALSGTVTIPEGSETATVEVAPLDDSLPEPDETVVVALGADAAYIVGTPSRATATIVSDETPPDLVVEVLTAPSSVGNVAAFTVTDTVKNQGGGPSGGSTLRFYLSRDALRDAGDTSLGDRAVPELVPGASSAGSTSLTIPPGTGSGTYYLIAEADATGVVAEGQEGNNTNLVLVQVRLEVVVTPGTIDLATPPAAFTITGNGFATAGFGLPVVNFMRGGALIAQARATALNGETSLTVPFPTSATSLTPGVPGLSAGPVEVRVFLQTGPSSYTLLGTGPLTVTDTRPAPGVSGITPVTIDLAMPPTAFTITGSGFENLGFGLPVVNFTRNGVLLAQARATALANGTTLTVPFPTSATSLTPGVPGLSAGAVQVQVYVQTGPTGYKLLGSTPLTVTDSRPASGVAGITPSSIDLADPPPSFTITGGGFENLGFGLPVVNFTRNNALLAQARATAVVNGTAMTVPFPTRATSLTAGVPGLSAGPVQVQVYVQTGPASYKLLGSTALTVADSRPPAGVTGITPSPISLASPPASFTITGGGFENQGFGLPLVNFTRSGALLGQARATAATWSALTVPFPTSATSLTPGVPGLSPGPVQVQVWLQTGPGSYKLLGSTTLTVQ
jgi:subtilisin family serine protease